MTARLQLEALEVRAESGPILDDISLSIEPGRIIAVVGANGSGKTTLLDAICGMVPIAGGKIEGVSASSDFPPSVGRVFQGSPLPLTLTVGEVAQLATGNLETALELLSRFGLIEHRTSFVSELSTGMRRILDIACALSGSPDILLLDEPSSGLARAEVDHLAEIIRSWRKSSGGAVLLVEHDLSLVRAVADHVVALERGVLVASGSPEEVLGRPVVREDSVNRPTDVQFQSREQLIRTQSRDEARVATQSISIWTLMRLGLRQFSAGMASVLILGVLNRVMKVELGVSLLVVALVLASYNLAAPIGIAIGHLSDRRPILKRHRAPYIVAGSIITGLTVAAAPFVATLLGNGVSVPSVIAAVGLFVAMGVGMYSAGSVFFALLSDLTASEDRARAASVVYIELLLGVLAGVGLVGALVDDQTRGLSTVFAIAGILIIVFSVLAVWGHERSFDLSSARKAPNVKLRVALRAIAGMSQARLFFAFMILSTLFLFLHQAVMEPFGGDILRLSVRQTSSFNAVMTLGIILGMIIAGRSSGRRIGHVRLATLGLITSSISLAGLSIAALLASTPFTWMAIGFLGLGSGILTVAAIALMMGMATPSRAALFMGVWTMAHAIADGAATGGGGIVYEIVKTATGNESVGYASVFGLESLGLALCILLLTKIHPKTFEQEATSLPNL